jgi:hypothetical protein
MASRGTRKEITGLVFEGGSSMNTVSRHSTTKGTTVAPRVTATRVRLSAAALIIAGFLFVLYPAMRPFSDEASLQGAAAFASPYWLASHMLAMVAFTLLPLGLLGLHSVLQETAAERLGFWAVVASGVGVGLTLPYYGGEAFGLHAIGLEALRLHSADLMSLANVVRSGPQLVMFAAGLLLLAAAAITVAVAVWRSGILSRWSGVPFATGFALYIPQFYGPQLLRVAHGLLVAIGCMWLAVVLWRQSVKQNGVPTHSGRDTDGT